MADGFALSVRQAAMDDVPDLVAMRGRLQSHMEAGNPALFGLAPDWQERKAAFYLDRIDDPQRRVLVGCIADSSIIGMGLGSLVHNPDLTPSAFGSIDDVWIMPQHRRRGYGTQIVAQLLLFFRQRQIEALNLTYSVGNTEATAFWSKLGFQPVLVMANGERQRTEAILSAHAR